jgi:ribosome maturation factor RimP
MMITESKDIPSIIEELAEPILNGYRLELVETQFRQEKKGLVLRLFIDRVPNVEEPAATVSPGSGVTLDDCVEVSREVGRLLDVEEVIQGAYTLEVSSPGLDRPLKKASDFERFSGCLVKIKIAGPEGRRTVKGHLIGLFDGIIKLDSKGSVFEVPLETAQRVQLEPEVDWKKTSL